MSKIRKFGGKFCITISNYFIIQRREYSLTHCEFRLSMILKLHTYLKIEYKFMSKECGSKNP
jgi:hypothetical protein